MMKTQHWISSACLALTLCAAAPKADAAVTVTFEQVGSDITMSWVGTLRFGVGISSNSSAGRATLSFGGTDLLYFDPSVNTLEVQGVGLAASTTLSSRVVTSGFSAGAGGASFGFSGDTIVYGASLISSGPLHSPTELAFTRASNTLTLRNTTLSSIGADSFNNTLAWTANSTGDTIRYTTVTSVPEPSSSALLGVGVVGLLLRRRR